MPNYNQYWFGLAVVSEAVPEFTVRSDCIVKFSYSAMVNQGNGIFLPISQIKEISFDPISRIFTMAKCSEASKATDPDCKSTPFFFTYEVAVIATLNDGVNSSSNDLRFFVTFGPDCRQDTLKFNNAITSITHYITSPPSETKYDPQFVSTIPNCPVSCILDQGG